MTISRMRSALLGSGAVVALVAAGVPASADEIEELRQQIHVKDFCESCLDTNRKKRSICGELFSI